MITQLHKLVFFVLEHGHNEHTIGKYARDEKSKANDLEREYTEDKEDYSSVAGRKNG